MRIFSFATLFFTLASVPAAAQTVINAIVNAGSGLVNASPGCMETIYGSNLAPSAADAPAGNLPTTLNGVTVMVAGIAAPLKYVSPGQINFQVPFEVTGASAPVIVNGAVNNSAPFTIQLQPFSPGLISIDPTHALVIGSDFLLKSTVQNLDMITLYAVGLGPTQPPTPTGAAGSAGSLNRVQTLPNLMIGGRTAQISFAGMAPGFPGVYQINATVPATPLDNTLVLGFGPVSSGNIVSFANNNVTNVTGSLNLLYPLSTSYVTFSPVQIVANYSASINLAANAQPFTVVAEASAGSSSIVVNPIAGTFTGMSTTPTQQERLGAFSGSGLTAIDFLGSGIPFPGDIIPVTRLDPAAISQLQSVPLPNVVSSPGIGMYSFASTFTPGPNITIAPTFFAGFSIYTSTPSSHTVAASVTLFVDGVPVTSQSATAKTP